MLKKIVVLIVFALFGCSWSNVDLVRHGAVTALMAIDYAQTMRIADNPDRWHEHNPIRFIPACAGNALNGIDP